MYKYVIKWGYKFAERYLLNIRRERIFMMKKNGFTLAEVLITLSIIGVIATLTLPTLMTNISESQYITGFKKGINTLSEAGQMNKVVAGYDYSEITSDDTNNTDEATASLFSLLRRNVAVNSSLGNAITSGGSGNTAVFFNDGTALIFTASATTDAGDQQADGTWYGFNAILDVNGNKGPNRLSNCNGTQSATADNVLATGGCANKANRVIQDRFSIRLTGTKAVPSGHAAAWAMNN